ncbi:MAG: cation-translocating P-type ATPase [Oscillospiraceae bacterium]|nr:cation-translocating P-type ATPase [Oscillospiraceae bacterium]
MLEILDKPYTASPYGLSSAEAAERLKKYGENSLASEKKARPLKIFLGQFRDIMILILLVATAISVFLGEIYDAVTIIIIVLLNAILGFIQEYKTERTLLALKNMTAPSAKCWRDGVLMTLPAAELVPGDIVRLEAGDKVPADGVILTEKGLFAEESVLTGESAAVEKFAGDPDDKDNSIGKSGIVYSGTVITKGTAEVKVIATGINAQVGKISGMLTDIEEEETPLQKRLGELGKTVAVICLVVCALVSAAGILRGEPVFDMLMTGITIAIAAIPEGLPATVTIALALAVSRMLKKNALVHKLHSVETLGCTSVICTDKTGTVTENKMTVTSFYAGGKEFSFTGNGYRMSGEITLEGARVNPVSEPALREALVCGTICTAASITADKKSAASARDRGRLNGSGEWQVTGDPTELALLVAAAKGGVTAEGLRSTHRKVDEIPFDSGTRCMTVICSSAGGRTAYTKGAVDVILKRCGFIMTDSGVMPLTLRKKQEIMSVHDRLTGNALRVLALCKKDLNSGSASDVESGMVFLGLAGMLDPPRAEAKKAVKLCRSAHIKTVMITGDHKNTAAAVAKQAGIMREGDLVLTGAELEAMSDNELDNVIERVSVFARVSPADKLRIVRAFKRRGDIVTMTGDGVNDAPAVKEAGIGVSMGITGTDVTKQAADMVLLDDNFATLVSAVEQGRGIYANIRKFVRYLLSCNIGEVLTMFLGIIMGMPMVLLPTQILLVNLVTDGLPAIALGVEPPEKENMKKPPRKGDESFFSEGLMGKIIFRGILIGLCTVGSFALINIMSGSVTAARTAALFTLVASQLCHVFECKSERKNIFTVPYLNNQKLIGAVLISTAVIFAAIYFPPLQIIFGTIPLTGQQLLIAAGFAVFAPLLQCLMPAGK